MTTNGQQLIGFGYSQTGNRTFRGIDPTTHQPFEPVFYEADEAEINQAVALADAAFSGYRKKSGIEKAIFLETVGHELIALGDELLQTAAMETALPLARLQGERGRTVGQLQLFANLLRDGSWVNARIDNAQPDRKPAPKPDIRQMQIPLGPVAVFGASNFPLAFSVAGGDTVSALAAGCPVIFKAHPAHPATCELVGWAIVRAAQRCGMPEGVFSMVQGVSHQVGMVLVQHPRIKAVGFTGSFRGGKALYDLAVRRPEPIPVYAEMGSTNPVFFLPGILQNNRAATAAAFVGSVTLGVGQFCTNPGVFALQESADSEAFLQDLAATMSAASGGFMLTPGILSAYQTGLARLRQQANTVATGTATDLTAQPAVLTVAAAQAIEDPSLLEEVFGPLTLGVVAQEREQLLSVAHSLTGHLTATVFGTPTDLLAYADLIDILQDKVGRLIINGFPTGVEVGQAMVHGGPFPATTDSQTTSVGSAAIYRFTRPICFQDFPQALLPAALQDDNPLQIRRLMNGVDMS